MSDHTTPMNHKAEKGMKTARAYIVGYVLSLLLTLAAFYEASVVHHSAHSVVATLIILAIVQLFVQVTCFLRLNASKDGRWHLMPFLFTIFIVLVIVFGSLWIMWNLNMNMMVNM